MSQFYSDASRESEANALPDCEVFHWSRREAYEYFRQDDPDAQIFDYDAGWYWWSCFPGCLPDGEANGPFDSEELAIEDARQLVWADSH